MALSKDSSSLSVRNELLWWSSLLRPHLCRRYLEAGADPSSNLGGLTALHIAAKRNLPHVVDTLSNVPFMCGWSASISWWLTS
eukprot:m.214091 g.214091  ORF g.214091 m.214091 type:complete len:83 (+) comp39804_c0_seq53:189-437(+)